jgi:hypothetical protein
MRSRGLAVAWLAVAICFVILLVWEVAKGRALVTEGARVAAERQQLMGQIRLREQQQAAEMRASAARLQDMQRASVGGDPSAYLTRLAELAQQRRLRVLSIGPLERQTTPQFDKSWRAVHIVGPFREIQEFVARVEQEGGLLEDVSLDQPPAAPASQGQPPAPSDEINVRFKMTAVELSAGAKKILERAMAAAAVQPGGTPAAPLALPVPNPPAAAPSPLRNPFAFVTPPAPRLAAGAVPRPHASPPQEAMELKGIMGFPGGYLAILNNQIVTVGDTVSGRRVEKITDSAVTLREPGGTSRTVRLLELAAPTAPATPRR